MKRRSSLPGERGFTLIELMVVVGIIGILVAIAGLSYRVFVKKAESVEAETALYEVNRLENLYHESHSTYSSDLTAIGYAPNPPLKYYTLELQVNEGAPGTSYQATAKPKGSQPLESFILTRYEDGTTVLEKVAPSTASTSPGNGLSQGSAAGDDSVTAGSSGADGSGSRSSRSGPTTVPLTLNPNPSGMTGGSASAGN